MALLQDNAVLNFEFKPVKTYTVNPDKSAIKYPECGIAHSGNPGLIQGTVYVQNLCSYSLLPAELNGTSALNSLRTVFVQNIGTISDFSNSF